MYQEDNPSFNVGAYVQRLYALARTAAKEGDWHSFNVFMQESFTYTDIWDNGYLSEGEGC